MVLMALKGGAEDVGGYEEFVSGYLAHIVHALCFDDRELHQCEGLMASAGAADGAADFHHAVEGVMVGTMCQTGLCSAIVSAERQS